MMRLRSEFFNEIHEPMRETENTIAIVVSINTAIINVIAISELGADALPVRRDASQVAGDAEAVRRGWGSLQPGYV